MNKIKIIAAAAVILSLAGCSNDGRMGADVDAGRITVDASIGPMTKVAYNGNSTAFSAGDQIAVYGWTGSADAVPAKLVVNGVRNTLGADGTWTPATQMLWKNGTDAHYFLGVYPARDITDFTADPYTLDPSPAAYTVSDLLMASKLDGVKATAGTVMLKFDHAMAKLNVNLKFSNEFATAPTVSSVKVKARKTATINYLTKSVTATGIMTPVDIPAAATAATGYVYSYSGLQVPQDGVTTIIVAIADKEYVYTSPTPIPLQSGKYTTLGLIVGRDNLELASVNVSNWPNATNLPGGVAALNIVHEYVDMGLSVKWATCNIGAINPTDYGDYFAWGETDTQYESLDPLIRRYNASGDPRAYDNTYKWCNGDPYNALTKYCNIDTYGNNGFTDNLTTLEPEDDAAHVNWGENWRMPTDTEWKELYNNCTFHWKTTADGYAHPGLLVVSEINGNSIFLPAAGISLKDIGTKCYYWSSSLETDEPFGASNFEGSSGLYSYGPSYERRYQGMPVRPVCP